MTTKEIPLDRPNLEQAEAYLKAYDHLNEHLFDSMLQRPMLTLSRNHQIITGYFSPNRWEGEGGKKIHEIAINANIIKQVNILEVMGFLIHQMGHLWQHDFGHPSRPGYHNKEFAQKMASIGLQIIGLDGAEVGQKVTQEIIEGGPVEEAIISLPKDAIFPWLTNPLNVQTQEEEKRKEEEKGGGAPPSPKKQKPGTRQKYQCPKCRLNAWAKPGVKLICGECEELMIEKG